MSAKKEKEVIKAKFYYNCSILYTILFYTLKFLFLHWLKTNGNFFYKTLYIEKSLAISPRTTKADAILQILVVPFRYLNDFLKIDISTDGSLQLPLESSYI